MVQLTELDETDKFDIIDKNDRIERIDNNEGIDYSEGFQKKLRMFEDDPPPEVSDCAHYCQRLT